MPCPIQEFSACLANTGDSTSIICPDLNDWVIGSGRGILINSRRPFVFAGGKVNLQIISVYD